MSRDRPEQNRRTRPSSSGGAREERAERRARQAARRFDQTSRKVERQLGETEAKVERQLDDAARKVERQLDDAARKIKRGRDDAARKLDRGRDTMEQRGGLIWGRPEPGARRPRFTRDQIAAAALRIADAEGIDAVSMRRVAGELGAGTMTLYHYIRGKDDLIDLMDDAMMREVLIPEGELPSGWRDAIAEVARRSHAAFMRHPWALNGPAGASPGPNGMRHFEQSVAAFAELGLPLERTMELIRLVDDYVVGHATGAAGARFGEEETPGQLDSFLHYVDEQIATGDFPHLEAAIGDQDPAALLDRMLSLTFDPHRFERGLQRLLDGIALELERER